MKDGGFAEGTIEKAEGDKVALLFMLESRNDNCSFISTQGHGETGQGREQGAQEGPGAAGQPAQVREVRGHVQPHVPQRGVRASQPQVAIRHQTDLREEKNSLRTMRFLTHG